MKTLERKLIKNIICPGGRYMYGVNQLRKMFLEFFEKRDHLIVKSFPLIPQNDKSLLLINSGMAPMKPYFTGQEVPPKKRVTTCQKCVRTGDIENVGKTARHLTFFEMLGNFSFGDYFKKESLEWTWEFMTKYCGLSGELLYPSIYYEDNEAFDIWVNDIGVPAERVIRFYRDENGDCDNFWEHGAGPCGPSSEVYYDRGEKYGCGSKDCKPGCECDRFIEVWNNVFTQFESDGNHNYIELAQKNIDTGMGLERLAVVVQDVESVFDIDTMKAIREHVCRISGAQYGISDKKDISIRLITDHIRSVTFMTSDGILPSNEGRGYVLRRLLRRAARHGRLLGIEKMFLADLCKTVMNESMDGYPELAEKRDYILKVLTIEEEKFNKTIDQGLTMLNEMAEKLLASNSKLFCGDDAFKLYDTYGFPIDLTLEILEEKSITIDMETFKTAMLKQKETARNARSVSNYMGADATVYDEIDPSITSVFDGYNRTEHASRITVLSTETQLVNEIFPEQMATIIVDETSFYPAMGGQIGDVGIIKKGEAEFIVEDTIKLKGGRIGHVGFVKEGMFSLGDEVELCVNIENRSLICRNHSATHLLQEALRQVLGTHVEQSGSLVTADRLRFDFTHFSAMTTDEISKVEAIINEQIKNNIEIFTMEMSIEDAKKTGAKALFGEKYSDYVRVVSIGEFSKELCGGTHAADTGEITIFKIVSENGIASGIRRIEAITSKAVFEYYRKLENELNEIARAAKTEPSFIVKRIETLQEEIKSLHIENDKLKTKLASSSIDDIMNNIIEVNGIKILSAKVFDLEMNDLRNLSDQLKDKLVDVILFLASVKDGKVSLVSSASESAVKKGAHSGNLIKAAAVCVGGGGGGRPNMAQAGGKDPSGVDAAVKQAVMTAEEQLNS